MVNWKSTSQRIAGGNAGSRVTVAAMSKLVDQGLRDPVVIQAAQDAIRNVPERDDRLTFEAVLADVRRRMRYTADPIDAEVVKAPRYVIERTRVRNEREPMDCDDVSVLLASMLSALGYQTQFVTVATDQNRPSEWSHVYVSVRNHEGVWVPLDPIVREHGVGWQVPNGELTAPRAYHRGGSPMSRMNGFAGRSGLFGRGLGAETPAGWYSPTSQYMPGGAWGDAQNAKNAPSTSGGFVDDFSKLFSSFGTALAPVAGAYVALKQKPARTNNIAVLPQNLAASQGGFFKKQNPVTGQWETDWVKVGIAAAAAGVGVLLLVKMTKGRR